MDERSFDYSVLNFSSFYFLGTIIVFKSCFCINCSQPLQSRHRIRFSESYSWESLLHSLQGLWTSNSTSTIPSPFHFICLYFPFLIFPTAMSSSALTSTVERTSAFHISICIVCLKMIILDEFWVCSSSSGFAEFSEFFPSVPSQELGLSQNACNLLKLRHKSARKGPTSPPSLVLWNKNCSKSWGWSRCIKYSGLRNHFKCSELLSLVFWKYLTVDLKNLPTSLNSYWHASTLIKYFWFSGLQNWFKCLNILTVVLLTCFTTALTALRSFFYLY